MVIYVFGNPDLSIDNKTYLVTQKLAPLFPQISFETIAINADIPTSDCLSLIDTVVGLSQATLFTESDLNKIQLSPRNSVHDYDLGFQLKYLVKLGKLKKVRIIGLPDDEKIDYDQLQSIFKKLVAQDIQGS